MRVVRVVEVVAQVLREQDGHQVGRGHAGGRDGRSRPSPPGGSRRPAAAAPAPARARRRSWLRPLPSPRRKPKPILGTVRAVKVAVAFDHRGVHLRDRSSRRCAGRATRSSTSAPTPTPSGSTTRTRRAELGAAIKDGEAERGVLVCGSGVGASVAACKIAGIRAAICHDVYSAHQGVEHDDMNVLCLGSEVVGAEPRRDLVRDVSRGTVRRRRALRRQTGEDPTDGKGMRNG